MIFLQYMRSFVFIVVMYLWMIVVGLLGAIPAAFSKNATYWVLKFYCASVIFLARVICGLHVEQRGEIPSGNVVVASKHQSFFDVMLHMYYLPRANFVMKQELKYAPILGFYAMRIGAAPVKRGQKSKAVSQMMQGAKKGASDGGNQLVIYPQGTRVAPGDHRPYKVGAGVLAQRMERPCVLAATNVGYFWPKRSMLRKPGTVIFEYFDTMPEGLELSEFVKVMEEKIEDKSNRLLDEAGFKRRG
ncbi:1-acyl-sn-glycerol-3-phosphate acyltransferase [Amylibacter marinus]|uniref:1-acyl-sn-glycerol-3-phosphate acyltransferase n=1 Tax=Amylibacter marinus TaxID=1475483 RepID=A0ABQ5VUQ7_9RHOB|nr:1-acyl-sn-glycerol-3-phosphate acyltransferase [Amylibacter marinus]GLQ35064.1 1-acyl-sn-glycerol-3-phosphate acyltransferase [Amylibacter marinus]